MTRSAARVANRIGATPVDSRFEIANPASRILDRDGSRQNAV